MALSGICSCTSTITILISLSKATAFNLPKPTPKNTRHRCEPMKIRNCNHHFSGQHQSRCCHCPPGIPMNTRQPCPRLSSAPSNLICTVGILRSMPWQSILTLNARNPCRLFQQPDRPQERRIQVLHNLSFVEDPTRIFRAIRFEGRLDFQITRHTEKLIKNAVDMPFF